MINKDIKNLTLVAGYIGKSNGDANISTAGYINSGGKFKKFGKKGAYAVGAIYEQKNNFKVQAWYYNAISVVNAYWLEAEKMGNINLGLIYTALDPKSDDKDSNAIAVKVGFNIIKALKMKIAYSVVNEDYYAGSNIGSKGQSKLYTDAWWNYGYVTRAGAKTINLTAKYDLSKTINAGIYYRNISANKDKNEMNDLSAVISKKYEYFKAKVAYVRTNAKDQNKDSAFDTLQFFLSANF